MRKILLIILFNMPILFALASTSPLQSKEPLASEVMMPLFNSGKFISVEDFMKLTPKSYKLITGKKMSFKEKIGLSFGKKSLRKAINKDGTIDKSKMKKGGFWGGFKWHWGGFALGFFLSILGPIVALFFNDEYKWDRFWTAFHTSIYVWLLLLIIVAAAGGAVY
ncbi:MAG TPA: hypothetical protein VIU35_03330 [Chitinophagaceae bacterium]